MAIFRSMKSSRNSSLSSSVGLRRPACLFFLPKLFWLLLGPLGKEERPLPPKSGACTSPQNSQALANLRPHSVMASSPQHCSNSRYLFIFCIIFHSLADARAHSADKIRNCFILQVGPTTDPM